MDLTHAQWSLIASLVMPDHKVKHRGRPHQDARAVINGVFWVLRTGARWADLPDRYPPHQTCHRRFREWLMNGTLFACFNLLAADLSRHPPAPGDDVDEGDEAEEAPYPDDGEAARGDANGDGDRSGTHRWAADGAAPRPGVRSWRTYTALLLQTPLARQALTQQQPPPSPHSAVEEQVGHQMRARPS